MALSQAQPTAAVSGAQAQAAGGLSALTLGVGSSGQWLPPPPTSHRYRPTRYQQTGPAQVHATQYSEAIRRRVAAREQQTQPQPQPPQSARAPAPDSPGRSAAEPVGGAQTARSAAPDDGSAAAAAPPPSSYVGHIARMRATRDRRIATRTQALREHMSQTVVAPAVAAQQKAFAALLAEQKAASDARAAARRAERGDAMAYARGGRVALRSLTAGQAALIRARLATESAAAGDERPPQPQPPSHAKQSAAPPMTAPHPPLPRTHSHSHSRGHVNGAGDGGGHDAGNGQADGNGHGHGHDDGDGDGDADGVGYEDVEAARYAALEERRRQQIELLRRLEAQRTQKAIRQIKLQSVSRAHTHTPALLGRLTG
jgi:hypothetical protein